jgi:trafficking protein particle complex subunit 2
MVKVNAIALVSALNHPIIVRSFSLSDHLKYNYVAHTSLDVIEERSQHLHFHQVQHTFTFISAVALGPKFMDCYLGHLYSLEDVAVYGYVTPTRIKIILALELADAVVRDADVVAVG